MELTPPLQRCAACGAVRADRFCAECGQKQFEGRHSLADLLRGGFGRVGGLEEGLVYTAYSLTVRPATVVRDYLAGRTTRYTHPVSYFFVALGAFALVSRFVSGATGAGELERILVVLVVPFVAAASRVLLWRAGFNYAEHLIALLYLAGQVLVLGAVLYFGVRLLPRDYLRHYSIVALGLALAYFLWAYSRAFLRRPLIAGLVGLLALVLGIGMWLIATFALVTMFRR
jgi:hypothetical protein